MSDEAGEEPQGFRDDDWISAAETIKRVREATLSPTSHIALAKRAHAGLLRAHADLMIFNEVEGFENTEVRAGFWWAEGRDALIQNWQLGDFETWINNTNRVRVFGVRFHRGDVERMLGGVQVERSRPDTVANKETGGRPMSALWPEWVAELAGLIHEVGVPDGSGTKGTDELISTVADRLAARGLEAPARATVQETAKAVLRRLRRAEN